MLKLDATKSHESFSQYHYLITIIIIIIIIVNIPASCLVPGDLN
jgi:hypothetical protein